MGVLRFLVPRRDLLASEALERAYFSGREDVPWRSRIFATSEGLTVDRTDTDSGCFHVLWRTAARGDLSLATATLAERDKPYLLPVELARGTLNRLRNQCAALESAGLTVPAAVVAAHDESLRMFSRAVTQQNEPAQATEHARESIDRALDTIDLLAAAFVEQTAAAREQIRPLFGCHLGTTLPDDSAAALLPASNAALVPLAWSAVEAEEGRPQWSVFDGQVAWCQAHGLRVCAGPLIELDKRSLPGWLYLWEGDFDNLLPLASQYVRAAVARYRGRVHVWVCAARLNTGEALSLTEEQKLRLAVQTIEDTRRLDPKAPVVISFDQPWGEHMIRRHLDLSPIHFADALVRADLGVSGLALEINLGFADHATLPRDPLEFSRQIDRFASLGLPLVLLLTVASGGRAASTASQESFVRTYLPVLLARQAVQAVFWNQLRDDETGEFPHSGLLDAFGLPKPVLDTLAELRARFSE